MRNQHKRCRFTSSNEKYLFTEDYQKTIDFICAVWYNFFVCIMVFDDRDAVAFKAIAGRMTFGVVAVFFVYRDTKATKNAK